MKKLIKRTIETIISILVILTLLPLSLFAYAETSGVLTYEIVDNEAVITDCDTSASGSLTIPSVINGYTVTTIKAYAFEYCKGLTEIILPDSVKTVGTGAFYKCSSLKSITISSGITTLSASMFSGCISLSNVIIPHNITEIKSEAFYNCSSLTSITIPKEVLIIGSGAFNLCENLKCINVESDNPNYLSDSDGVMYNKDKSCLLCYPIGISNDAYSIRDGVKEIGEYAFSNCKNLHEILLPDSLTCINNYAFSNCTNLDSITIPQNVDTIQPYAFNYSVKYINVVQENLSYCGDSFGVLYNKNMTELVDFPNRSPYKSYSIVDGVTKINDNTFSYCCFIESISIPGSVREIGNSAFCGCQNLKDVLIADGTTLIDNYAFENCPRLESIRIPDSVKILGNYSFRNCYLLSDVVIGDGVTEIGRYAFDSCNNIESLTIPCSVTVGSYSFDDCSNIKKLTLTKGTGTFKSYYSSNLPSKDQRPWVKSKSSLEEVIIEEGVQNISRRAFYKCNNLKKVSIPASVKYISSYAFQSCSNLSEVYIDSISAWCSIGFADTTSNPLTYANNLYVNDKQVTELVIPEDVTSIKDYAFYKCESINKISIHDNVTDIGKSAFSFTGYYNDELNWENGVLYIDNYLIDSNDDLGNVSLIKNNTKTIAKNAFINKTNLSYVVIPQSVNNINSGAFSGCTGLETVIITDGTNMISTDAFSGCLDNLTFKGYKDSYAQQYCADNGYNFEVYSLKLTYDSNGGNIGKYDQLTYSINPINDAPIPQKEGVFFDGWYDMPNYGNKLNSETIISPQYMYYTCYNYYHYFNSSTKRWSPDLSETFNEYHTLETTEQLGVKGYSSVDPSKKYYQHSCNDCGLDSSIWYFLGSKQKALVYSNASVYAHWIKSIKINNYPQKTDYYLGEKVDTSDMDLMVIYDNGDVKIIDSGFDIDVSSMESVGKQIVTVNYKGATTNYSVNVSSVEPKALSINTLPNKTSFFVGDDIDFSGLSLMLEFNNGDTEIITDGFSVESIDMSISGEKTVTVSYDGLSTEFNISVIDIVPVSVSLSSLPDKLNYFVGDSIDTTGLSLDVTYNNGSVETVTEGFSCSPNVFSQSGNQTVNVTYRGFTSSFEVSVQKVFPTELIIKNLPQKTKYYIDDELQTKGLSLVLKYNNLTEKTLDSSSNIEFNYDFSSVGKKEVTVSYSENGKNINCSFLVDVYEKENIFSDLNVSSNSGDVVSIPVYISNNNGISGFKIRMNYDPNVFTPVSITPGSVLNLSDDTSIISMLESNLSSNPNGKLEIIWASTENVENDGLLFVADFKVASAASGDYSITLDYDADSTFDSNGDPVKMNCRDIDVLVKHTDTPDVPTLRMERQSAKPGDEICIPFKAFNISATDELEVNIAYDKDSLTYLNGESYLMDQCEFKIKSNGLRITITDLDAVSDCTLFVLKFRVSDKANGDYSFDITAENADLEEINIESDVISVSSSVVIYGEDVQILPGTEKLDIPIYIKNNHGIMGYGLYIDFDSESFTLDSVSRGSALAEGNFDYNVISDGRLFVSWFNSIDNNDSGEIFVIHFILNDDYPKISDVNISYDEDNTFNEAWENVELECHNLGISVLPDEIIFAKSTSSAVVKNECIYGLNTGLTSLNEYIDVYEGFTLSYPRTIGTNTTIEAKLNGETVKNYKIVIFGDVNGDGWYDGQDAVTVSMIAGGMLTREQVGEAVWMAADCNHDGVIDQADVDLLNQAGVLLSNVDQTKSTDELIETSSEYVEYLNLIDQQTDADSDETPEDNTEENEEPTELNLWNIIVKYFVELIKKFLSVIKVF